MAAGNTQHKTGQDTAGDMTGGKHGIKNHDQDGAGDAPGDPVEQQRVEGRDPEEGTGIKIPIHREARWDFVLTAR